MKGRFALLLLIATLPVAGQYSPESFDRALSDLDSTIEREDGAVAASLPDQWSVDSASHTYSVPTGPLRNLLKESNLPAAHAWIADLRDHVSSYRLSHVLLGSDSRQALQEILSRSEFKSEEEPSPLSRLFAPIREWWVEFMRSIFQFAAQHPTGSQILFWTLVVAATAALFTLLLRFWIRADRMPSLPVPGPIEPTVQSWQKWLASARSAFARADYRETIRCAYWAGISRLQQDRRIRIDLADTPRERLRFLTDPPQSGKPLPPDKLMPLASISQRFERGWYAKLPVDAEDAAQSLRDTEALGCRVD